MANPYTYSWPEPEPLAAGDRITWTRYRADGSDYEAVGEVVYADSRQVAAREDGGGIDVMVALAAARLRPPNRP